MQLMTDSGVDHVSYILLLYSISFLLYLFVNLLLHLYASHAWPVDQKKEAERRTGRPGLHRRGTSTLSVTEPNGSAMGNGHLRRPSDIQRVRDAEAFELEGLMSEGEEDLLPKEENPSQERS